MFFVIGGLNTDISATPVFPLLERDSNIGHVRITAGGVGRNIAEQLIHLGIPVQLIAALGDDPFAAGLTESCRRSGIGLRYALTVKGDRSGVYICMNELDGDMFIAMNDMAVCNALTPDTIDLNALNAGEGCVLDANIPEETLAYVARHASIPLFCDPVSVAKCGRVKPILPYLTAIKPNLMEATALTGERSPNKAAMALVEAGVEQAYVSLGAEGICYADARGFGFVKAEADLPILNTTGAGDATVAAICAGWRAGLGVAETARFACRTAVERITTPKEKI